ncbi:Ig-like domain-containing protein [Pseudomonas sp. PSPC3-3]|uniref:Ig-like domain-containing protein n=1 Tax=unclassified Pseudomonas TaxID=196821 RepID=UPI003CF2B803
MTSVTGVTLSQATMSLQIGNTKSLTATVAPAEASNTSVTWASSNPAVATVSSAGVVKAVTQGTASVSCTTVDGSFTKNCAVTVPAP